MSSYNRDKPKMYLDNNKLALYTKNAIGKNAALKVGIHNNNPRIIVYTNDPSESVKEKEYGVIRAELDTPTFIRILDELQTMATEENQENKRYRIINKNYIFPNGKRSNEPVPVSEVLLGRTDGRIWIAVRKKNRPDLQFFFGGNSAFHIWHGADGEFTPAQDSKAATLSWVRYMFNTFTNYTSVNYVAPATKEGAGNSRYGNSGGGNSAPSDNVAGDDDLPF